MSRFINRSLLRADMRSQDILLFCGQGGPWLSTSTSIHEPPARPPLDAGAPTTLLAVYPESSGGMDEHLPELLLLDTHAAP